MAEIIDDKSAHCIPFILARHAIHAASSPSAPFFIGINGVQGVGKSTLVSLLLSTLHNDCNLVTEIISLDDLYLTHADQVALAEANPSNPLIQHRGEPGMPLPTPQSAIHTDKSRNPRHSPRQLPLHQPPRPNRNLHPAVRQVRLQWARRPHTLPPPRQRTQQAQAASHNPRRVVRRIPRPPRLRSCRQARGVAFESRFHVMEEQARGFAVRE